MWAWPAGCKII